MKQRHFIGLLILTLAVMLPAGAQSLYVGEDVPRPKAYQIRYTSQGQPYVIVTRFERVKTGTGVQVTDTGVTTTHAGRITRVTRARQADHVTLRAANGHTFGVRTGDTFRYAGRRFVAEGFNGNVYFVRCARSGVRFSFIK